MESLKAAFVGDDRLGDLDEEPEFVPTEPRVAKQLIFLTSCILFVECIFVPVVVAVVILGYDILVYPVQAIFLGASLLVQRFGYHKLHGSFATRNYHDSPQTKAFFEQLESDDWHLFGIVPMKCLGLGIKMWQYNLMSYSLSFISLLGSAAYLGVVWEAKSNGWLALYIITLVWCSGLHLSCTLYCVVVYACKPIAYLQFLISGVGTVGSNVTEFEEWNLGCAFDSANMLFLGMLVLKRLSRMATAHRQSGAVNERWARAAISCSTKSWILCVKISITSIIWDRMNAWHCALALQAIFVSYASLLPLAPDLVVVMWVCVRKKRWLLVFFICPGILGFFVVLWLVLPVYFIGIFVCPSHVFSLIKVDCV